MSAAVVTDPRAQAVADLVNRRAGAGAVNVASELPPVRFAGWTRRPWSEWRPVVTGPDSEAVTRQLLGKVQRPPGTTSFVVLPVGELPDGGTPGVQVSRRAGPVWSVTPAPPAPDPGPPRGGP
jgi:hypothetical protein